MFTKKLGVIGVGVMGQAIMGCVVDSGLISVKDVALFDVLPEKTEKYRSEFTVCSTLQELLDISEYVLISIKPQHFASMANSVVFSGKNKIISIMAGVRIETIRSFVGNSSPIARVMPNTPCRIGKGVCAVCFDQVAESDKDFVIKMLSSCGDVVQAEEKYFDAVTSVIGSGPAYVYMFLDGMIKGGMNGGLDYDSSKKLAIATLIGTAHLAGQSNESLEDLTEKVCSKGGTTIEAVKIFREKGLETIVQEGIEACRKRSEELSNK